MENVNTSITGKPCVAPNCQRIHTTPTQTNVMMDQIQHVLQSLLNEQKTTTKDILQTQLVSLLECPICCSCLYQPSTTPCGHTFCQPCLVRSLDHMPACPICRQSISWAPPPTTLLCQLVQSLFSQQIRQEEVQEDGRVPILVGSLAFPHVRCVIHIFEPRYRLMLRRVMASRRHRFAMCLSLRKRAQGSTMPFHEYGTMLELTHVQTLEDGRSIVQAVGSYRFRVLNHAMVDGYHVGELERIDDIDGEQEQALEREQIMRASAQRIQQAIHTTAAANRTTPAHRQNNNRSQSQLPHEHFDRSSTPSPLQQQQSRPRPNLLGGRMMQQPTQRRSWAAQAHPQTQMARSPWLQMHLRGLSPAQTKSSPVSGTTIQTPAIIGRSMAPSPSSSSSQSPTFNVTTSTSNSQRHEETSTDDLIQQLSSFITTFRNNSTSSVSTTSPHNNHNNNNNSMNQLSQFLHVFGNPPPIQGPRRNQIIFTWWVVNMMPLDQEEKAKLLAMRMLRERVLTITKWVDRFKDQWSFWLSQPNRHTPPSSSSCPIS